jgi:uncharacterized protein (TIRG00374 family)
VSDVPPVQSGSSNLARRLLAGVLLGVVVYGTLVALRGTSAIRAELAHFAPAAFAFACCLSLVNYGVRFLKWEYYLSVLGVADDEHGQRVFGRGESLLVFLSGFVLTVTPGKVGEVFKSVVLWELRRVPVVRTAPIVVAERLTDLVGVIALIAAGSAVFPGGALWATAGAATVLAILVLVSVPRVGQFAVRMLEQFGRTGARVAPKVSDTLDGIRVLTTPSRLMIPTALSIVGWSLEGVGTYVLLRGFGATIEPLRAAFSYATATLAGALVPVPGGLGVTEKVLEESMVQLGGVPKPVATAAMLLGRLATLWLAVFVGFVALAVLRALHPSLLASDPASSGVSGQKSAPSE